MDIRNWAKVKELVEKYSGSGPRYTSYPTAVEFHAGVDNERWAETLRAEQSRFTPFPLSLYTHIPFCPSLCYFCACHKTITQSREIVRPYLTAVFREIDQYQQSLSTHSNPLEQLHWGGGSPNYLQPGEMEELFERERDAFGPFQDEADISVELDPRTTTSSQVETLRRLGFNRISLGVQDFSENVQETINRIQPYEMTKNLCDVIRSQGIAGLNIDLIYGLPQQTVDGFERTIDQVITLSPDRIALYGYAHVTWLHKVQQTFRNYSLPTPEERLAIFLRSLQLLTEAGYVYIGLDHFAKPDDSLARALLAGTLNRNFMGYTTHRGARILGFGASAISTLAGGFAQNVKDVDQYQQRVSAEGWAIERGLLRTADDQFRGEIIERLLCGGIVDFAALASFWGDAAFTLLEEVTPELRRFEEDELLVIEDRVIRLSSFGRLFARSVAMCFDDYLHRHRTGQKPVFSQAV